jgi:hypothetical protein
MINVIVRAARPGLGVLADIVTSLQVAVRRASIPVKVDLLLWTPSTDDGMFDAAQRVNFMFKRIPDGNWVYILDDDTKCHPDLFREFFLAGSPDIFVVSAQRQSDVLVAAPENVCVGQIDVCQFIVRRGCIGDLQFQGTYTQDGEFISALYERIPESFVFSSKILAFYNYFAHDGGF